MKPMLLTRRTRTRLASNTRPRQDTRQEGAIRPGAPESSNRQEHGSANNQLQYNKYSLLAREAVTMGDRVLAESYYQQAEHHLRVMSGQPENVFILSKE